MSLALNLEISNFYIYYITQLKPNLMCQVNNYLPYFMYTASLKGQLLTYLIDKCLIDTFLDLYDFFKE